MSHLNLPRLVTSTNYNNTLKNIANNNVDIAEPSMIKASRTLIFMYTINYDNTDVEKDVKKNCKKDVEKAVPVGVAVDGTWQKRYGFNSLQRVVFIISIAIGEVLDYEIKCKHVLNAGPPINGIRTGITSMNTQ